MFDDVLELDELWSFVRFRKNKRWVWLAQCRRTRQIVAIVAYAIGDRSETTCALLTCALLWGRVPDAYKSGKVFTDFSGKVFTDFWNAYQMVIPETQHRPGGKGAGQTCHIERFNNTLRQRLARLVRKTLSLSKSDQMHEICLLLFLHDHNRRIRRIQRRLNN